MGSSSPGTPSAPRPNTARARRTTPARALAHRAPAHSRKTVGRKTASAAIIASEKKGSPSSTAMARCSAIINASNTFFARRLSSANGNATCVSTVPYVTTSTSSPCPASIPEIPGHGENDSSCNG